MSGAGKIKDDGHTDESLFEVKDARASFTLRAAEMRGLFRRAIAQGKLGVLLVYFSDEDFTVECRLVPGGKEAV